VIPVVVEVLVRFNGPAMDTAPVVVVAAVNELAVMFRKDRSDEVVNIDNGAYGANSEPTLVDNT
jgi:hypothetical protein